MQIQLQLLWGSRAHAHAHTCTRTHTDTHTLTHTHMHAHVALTVLMGFAKFPALPATLPHLSVYRYRTQQQRYAQNRSVTHKIAHAMIMTYVTDQLLTL